MALLNTNDQISESLDVKKYFNDIFFIFGKCLIPLIIDYCILLQQLQVYGIRGCKLKWFSSYLTDRSQCVCIDNIRSTSVQIKCGVPQGFILDPLLFIIYIIDIVESLHLLQFIMFADDTNLFA